MSAEQVPCPNCPGGMAGGPTPTFLGFRKYTCRACKTTLVHPLWPWVRALYWILVVAFLVESVRAFGAGEFPLPGIIVIVAGYALARDRHRQVQVRDRRRTGSEVV